MSAYLVLHEDTVQFDPNHVIAGHMLELTFVVENKGDQAGGAPSRYQLVDAHDQTMSDVMHDIAELQPGETRTINTAVTLPEDVGDYWFRIWVDPPQSGCQVHLTIHSYYAQCNGCSWRAPEQGGELFREYTQAAMAAYDHQAKEGHSSTVFTNTGEHKQL